MQKYPTVTIDLLMDEVKKYINDEKELDMINKAYEYIAKKYFGMKRLTGDNFIIHPLSVAYILTDLKADYATISAALLHEVMKDESVTKEELKDMFNLEIAELVDGVNKINKLSFSGDGESEKNNNRKILVGLSEDVRVIFIKLADRLHNMRTLWVHPEEVQKEKAKETLDILTPIAHRLGVSKIKSELEDLSLRYYKPDYYFSIVEMVNKTKSEREMLVSQMIENISKILDENNIKHEIKGRAKSIYSIYKKLDKGKKFSDIYDLLALRVYVDKEAECYQVLGLIHSLYKPLPKRFKDYIAMPKPNMYQSLHTTVIGIDGNFFEIQIRTYEMDYIAEKGIAAHWSYKEHGSNNKASMKNTMEQKLQFFRTMMELKKEANSDEEIANTVKEDFFKDTIYVFTPKGSVIELAKGSTPIDFAYAVHTDVGNKMVGSIVNGNIVPFDYELHDNDVVKINTNKNAIGPSYEWLNIVKTSQARNKIRSFLNKVDKEKYLKNGQEFLNKELRRKKISITEFLSQENIDKILKELKLNDINELYINIGSNNITATQVINIVNSETISKEELIIKKTANSSLKEVKPNKNDIIVRGIDEIKVNVASCCKPVPGDNIVGFITKGYGITIHKSDCPNTSDVSDRLIDVYWNENISQKYETTILVRSITNNNVLLDVVAKCTNNDLNVKSINTINHDDEVLYELTISVINKEKLDKVIREIELINNVKSVSRIIK